jgi:hypothetical protein
MSWCSWNGSESNGSHNACGASSPALVHAVPGSLAGGAALASASRRFQRRAKAISANPRCPGGKIRTSEARCALRLQRSPFTGLGHTGMVRSARIERARLRGSSFSDCRVYRFPHERMASAVRLERTSSRLTIARTTKILCYAEMVPPVRLERTTTRLRRPALSPLSYGGMSGFQFSKDVSNQTYTNVYARIGVTGGARTHFGSRHKRVPRPLRPRPPRDSGPARKREGDRLRADPLVIVTGVPVRQLRCGDLFRVRDSPPERREVRAIRIFGPQAAASEPGWDRRK